MTSELESVVAGARTAPIPRKLVTTIWKPGDTFFAGGSEKFDEPTKPIETWPQSWKGLVSRILKGQKLAYRDDKREHPHLGLYFSPQGFRSNREGDVVLRTGLHIDIDEGTTDETITRLVETLRGWGLAAIVQRRDVVEPYQRKLRAIIPLVPDEGRETFYSRASAFLIALSETIGCPIDLAPAVWSQPTFIYGPVRGRERPRVVAQLDGEALDLSDVEGSAWGRQVRGEACPDAVQLCRDMFEIAGSTFSGHRCTRPPDGDNPSAIEFMPDGGFRCWTLPTYQVRAWLKDHVSEAYERWWRHPGRRIERARSQLRTRAARVDGQLVQVSELRTLLSSALSEESQQVFVLPEGFDARDILRNAMEGLHDLVGVMALPDVDAEVWDPSVRETSHALALAHRDAIDRLAIVGRRDAIESVALTQNQLEALRHRAAAQRSIAASKRQRVRTFFEYIVEDLFFAGHLHTIPEWTLPEPVVETVDSELNELLDAQPSELPQHLQEAMDAARQHPTDNFDSVDAERMIRRIFGLAGVVEARQDHDATRVLCIPEWTQRSFVMLCHDPDPALEHVCPDARWIRFEGADSCHVERTWFVTAPPTSDDASDEQHSTLPAFWKAHVAPRCDAASNPVVCVRHPETCARVRDLGYGGQLISAADIPSMASLDAHDVLIVLGAPLPPKWHPEAESQREKSEGPRDPGFWRAMERHVERGIEHLERSLGIRSRREPSETVRVWYFGPSFPSPPWREDECTIVAA